MGDILPTLLEHKAAGNALYQQKDFEGAVAAYSKGVKLLPDLDDEDELPEPLPADLRKQAAIVLCNRAACHLGLNKGVRALADAQQAGDWDGSNWKVRSPPAGPRCRPR